MALSTIQNNSFADTAVHGYRNLIINGAMQVAQRGTSSTSTGYQTVDRFRMVTTATDQLAFTQSQDSNAPDGFAESYKVEITTPESLFTSTEWFYLRHTIEGQNAQRLKFGTSSASQTTLSFWVKSSVTGTYAVLFFNDQGSSRGQTLTYTITSANTWEYKTIVFDGDTAQNFANSNAAGPDLYFTLSAGPDRKTADGSSWQNYSSQQSAYGQTADVGGTASATWQITGVQLEVGSEATPFEHRPYADELRRCQRYYYQVDNGTQSGKFYAMQYTASYKMFHIPFPTTMRATPTSTLPISSGAITEWNPTKDSVLAYIPSSTSDTGTYHIPSAGNSAKFDAEL